MASEAAPEYHFGEFGVQAKVTQAEATVEEIAAEATRIWGEVREWRDKQLAIAAAAGTPLDVESESFRTKISDIQKNHRDFMMSFPIVVRWMVQAGKFALEPFTKFVLRFASNRPNTRRDFVAFQADYLVLLYKHENPRYDNAKVQQYRQQFVERLLAEDDEFAEMTKQVEADFDARGKEIDADRRQALIAHLMRSRVNQE